MIEAHFKKVSKSRLFNCARIAVPIKPRRDIRGAFYRYSSTVFWGPIRFVFTFLALVSIG